MLARCSPTSHQVWELFGGLLARVTFTLFFLPAALGSVGSVKLIVRALQTILQVAVVLVDGKLRAAQSILKSLAHSSASRQACLPTPRGPGAERIPLFSPLARAWRPARIGAPYSPSPGKLGIARSYCGPFCLRWALAKESSPGLLLRPLCPPPFHTVPPPFQAKLPTFLSQHNSNQQDD